MKGTPLTIQSGPAPRCGYDRAMTDAEDRILPLDIVRGAAIIGVVLMNVATILLPRAVAIFPSPGTSSLVDALVWLAGFVVVDGKARALLAMLFGASSLLVIDRAEMDGRDGVVAQQRRLLWLIPIGLAHYTLVWSGDILILLAVGGLISLRFAAGEPLDLLKAAFLFFAAQMLLAALLAVMTYATTSPADYAALLQREMVLDIAIHRDGWLPLVTQRLTDLPHAAALMAVHALPETLGFMMLGMAMAKGGFFTGQWSASQYRSTAIRALLVSVPPTLALGLWAMVTRDSRSLDMIGYAASFPFRIPMAIGEAALLVMLAGAASRARVMGAIAAVGRMALTNYLASSLIVTSLAYGYGAGFYAHPGRIGLLAIALSLVAAMLVWSPLWLARAGRGPAERLWRRLQRIGAGAA